MPESIGVRSSYFGRSGCYPSTIPGYNNLVDQAVCLRLLGGQKTVTLGIFSDFWFWLARVMYQDIVQDIFQTQNFTGVNFDIGRLSLDATKWLMDHNGGTR